MTTLYLVMADRMPVLAFPDKSDAELFSSARPDLKVHEFKVPAANAEHNEVTDNLRELFTLKQIMSGKPAVLENPGDAATLETILKGRIPLHQTFLKKVQTMVQTQYNEIGEQCQKTACPGRMFEGILTLK